MIADSGRDSNETAPCGYNEELNPEFLWGFVLPIGMENRKRYKRKGIIEPVLKPVANARRAVRYELLNGDSPQQAIPG